MIDDTSWWRDLVEWGPMVFNDQSDLLRAKNCWVLDLTLLWFKLTLSTLVFCRSSLDAVGMGDLLLLDMISSLTDGDLENKLSFYCCKSNVYIWWPPFWNLDQLEWVSFWTRRWEITKARLGDATWLICILKGRPRGFWAHRARRGARLILRCEWPNTKLIYTII